MSKGEKDHGEYVRKVQQETQRYSQDLLEENDRLRLRLASVEAEASGLQSKLSTVDSLVEENRHLLATLASAREEGLRNSEQLDSMRRRLSQRDFEAAELRRRLQAAEADSKRFSLGYSEVERQNSNLANLYVASYRLHATLDRAELVQAIQEIVANLVGCEEMGIFDLEPEAGVLRLVGSFGIAADEYAEIPAGSGIIGHSASTGEPFVGATAPAERSPLETHLTACIPLTVEGKVTGAIALFRLLSHKDRLADVDHEIFDLLAAQAGAALYCTRLHGERLRASLGAER